MWMSVRRHRACMAERVLQASTRTLALALLDTQINLLEPAALSWMSVFRIRASMQAHASTMLSRTVVSVHGAGVDTTAK